MRANGLKTPEGRSAFEYTFKKQLWQHIGTDPARQKDMMDYMAGRRKDTIRWVDIFPAGTELGPLIEENNAVRLVDIGGNQGHDLKLFKQTYPQLCGRLILLDLPAVIDNLLIPIDGVEFLLYEFFTSQVIQGKGLLNRTTTFILTNILCRCTGILLSCNMARLLR
jgi:hypothetical protein